MDLGVHHVWVGNVITSLEKQKNSLKNFLMVRIQKFVHHYLRELVSLCTTECQCYLVSEQWLIITINFFFCFVFLFFQVYLLRKMATNIIGTKNRRFYICSLSCDTIVYKVKSVILVVLTLSIIIIIIIVYNDNIIGDKLLLNFGTKFQR